MGGFFFILKHQHQIDVLYNTDEIIFMLGQQYSNREFKLG